MLVVSGSDSKVWIGLHKEDKLSSVQWSDGSPVTFTSWYSQEPSHSHGDKLICVTADWKVRSEVRLMSQDISHKPSIQYVVRKDARVQNQTAAMCKLKTARSDFRDSHCMKALSWVIRCTVTSHSSKPVV